MLPLEGKQKGSVSMENKETIVEMMTASLSKIREMVDVNTVVGQPIETPDGTTIIPVSKVAFGFGAGGTDWGATKNNFGGGAGAGISISPVSFLVVTPTGVRLLPMEPNRTSNTIERVVELVPSVVDKIDGIIKKYKA